MQRVRRRSRSVQAVTGGLVALLAAVMAAWSTDPHAPPRFDGAGYAVLAESLRAGRGYREIDHPDAPRHAHFPPGYPALLALTWGLTGRSVVAAHALSLACTTGAVLAAWCWFRRQYRARVAAGLGLALALNWTWDRAGGSIQSEPLFLLLGQLALLVAASSHRRGGTRRGLLLGALLAACVLTRQVGLALAAAVVVDLLLVGRTRTAVAAALSTVGLLVPWLAWLATVRARTQVGLLDLADLPERTVLQAIFYVQRIPDQITGPFVEVATVFRRGVGVGTAANAWACLASGLIVVGLFVGLLGARRRLAGLLFAWTMALLLVWPFTEAGRFLVPLVPCLLMGAVEGLAVLGRPISRRRARLAASWLVLAMSVPYSAYAAATDRAGALRRTHADFDAACQWIARHGTRPGPVVTRHPGELYWQTGRQAIAPGADDPDSTGDLIARYGAAYLVVDSDRYAGASEGALGHYVRAAPRRVSKVWERSTGQATVAVFEVVAGP